MKNYICLLFSFTLCFTFPPCRAEIVAKDRYVWSGEINRQGIDALRAELKKNSHVHAIEFRNSLGASQSAGVLINEINELIRHEKLETYAWGYARRPAPFRSFLEINAQ